MKMLDYDATVKAACESTIWDLCDTREFLSYLPIIEATPVCTEKMIERYDGDDSRLCLKCRESWNSFYNEVSRFKFCPNCGSKVEIENVNELHQ